MGYGMVSDKLCSRFEQSNAYLPAKYRGINSKGVYNMKKVKEKNEESYAREERSSTLILRLSY
jgi:hypothetical protein